MEEATMAKPVFDFDKAISTYLITDHISEQFSHHCKIFDGSLIINYTSCTDVFHETTSDTEVVIIGYCIDAHNELDRDDIPQFLASVQPTLPEAIYRAARRFAGRYVILYRHCNTAIMFGDSYGLLQINYGDIDGHPAYASLDVLIGHHFHLNYSRKAQELRHKADYTQALPYQMTLYNEVKLLPANHYLVLPENHMVRVPLRIRQIKTKEDEQWAISRSLELIRNTLRQMKELGPIECPLTAGSDSRVVLAFLLEDNPKQPCYTFWHQNFTEKTPDLVIPKTICEDNQLPYQTIDDLEPDDEYLNKIRDILGPYYSVSTIGLSYTFKSAFNNAVSIHSDILDQVGKSSIGKNIPSTLGTASFLTCKTHVFSSLIFPEMKKLVADFRSCGETQNRLDLFSIEQDGSRWVAQGLAIASICGHLYLNIFSSGELLDIWLGLPICVAIFPLKTSTIINCQCVHVIFSIRILFQKGILRL